MSKAPFEYFDEYFKTPIDLQNQEHRDLVIQRNKKLNQAIENGLDIEKTIIRVTINVTLSCLKCGTRIDNDFTMYYEDVNDDGVINDNIPSVKCGCCSTSYCYSERTQTFKLYNPMEKVNIEEYKIE